MTGQLLRPRHERKIAGVCAAFARTYGWDVTLVRLVLVALVLFGGGGFLAYVLCWIFIPEDPIALPVYPPSPGYAPPAQQVYGEGSQVYPPNTKGYPSA